MQAFGFSKKKAPQPKVAVQQEADAGPAVEYVTGVQGNAIEGTREEKKDEVKVIPAIQNTFEVGTGRRRKVRAPNRSPLNLCILGNVSTDVCFSTFQQVPIFIPTKEEVMEDEKRFHVA